MSDAEPNENEGHRARHETYEVAIAGADLEFHPTTLSDPVPTGLQIALAFGCNDPNELIVLQQLPNFELEELRLNETSDLRARGVKRFIVTKSDRTFRFIVDGLKLEWFFSDPTALIVKKLVGKEVGYELIQELEDDPDRVLEDHEHLCLEGGNTERFKTRKAVHLVTVKYNHKEFKLEAGSYTTEELLTAFSVPTGYVLDRVANGGDFIELKPRETTCIIECMEFFSHAPCGGAA